MFTTDSGGNADIALSAGSRLVFTPDNWSEFQRVRVTAGEDADALAKTRAFRSSASGLGSLYVTVYEEDDEQVIVVSVNGQTLDDLKADFSPSADAWTVEGDAHVHAGVEGGTATATWQFEGLASGSYEVLVTWNEGADRATQAPFTIIDGSAEYGIPRATVGINQKAAPVGTVIGSETFQSLGVFDVSGNTLTVQLSNDADGTVVADAIRLMPISDDPLALSVPEGSEETIWIRLQGDPCWNRLVQTAWVNGDGDLAVTSGGSVTFTPGANGDWGYWKPVTLWADPDNGDGIDGVANFQLVAAGWPAKTQRNLTVTEFDDDRQIEVSLDGVTVAPEMSVRSIAEGGLGSYWIRLKADPGSGATVEVTTTRDPGGTDALLTVTAGQTATFTGGTEGNWDDWQLVSVTAGEDDKNYWNGTATFVSSAPGWQPGELVVEELDNDRELQVEVTELIVPEGGSAAFGVRLNAAPQGDVTVTISGSLLLPYSRELQVSPATLTFTTADWNVFKDVTVTLETDADAIAGTATVSLQATGWTDASVAIIEQDKERLIDLQRPVQQEGSTEGPLGAGAPVVNLENLLVPEEGSQEFQIRLQGDPGAPVTVQTSWTAGDEDLQISEGASLHFDSSNWDQWQNVTVVALSDGDVSNGSATFTVSIPGWPDAIVTAQEQDDGRLIEVMPITQGDMPIVGDWNGDGIDEIGAFNSLGWWYLDINGNRRWDDEDQYFAFGQPGDEPLVGDWNGDGIDEVGFHRGNEWYLDSNGNGIWDGDAGDDDDTHFVFGAAGDEAVIGNWNDNIAGDEIGIHRGGTWYLDVDGNCRWNLPGDAYFQFGISGDEPIVGDWNGDGTDEVGLHRDDLWYLDASGDTVWGEGDWYLSFGADGDVPVIGDWDGDGWDEIGVYRDDRWYLDTAGLHRWRTGNVTSFTLEPAGDDVSLVGDWNGNGQDDIGIRRGDQWYLDSNGNGVWDSGDSQFSFGEQGDEALVGDWNGDGSDEVGFHRGREWYLDLNGDNQWNANEDVYYASFGAVGDEAIIGDWNGDGRDEIGVHRGNTWYLDIDGNGVWNAGDTYFTFGITGDKPLVGDWDGNGTEEVGIRRDNTWYLDIDGDHCWNLPEDVYFLFGVSGDEGVVGDWNGDGKDEIGARSGNTWQLDSDGNREDGPGDESLVFEIAPDEAIAGDWNGDDTDEVGVFRGDTWYLDVNDNRVWDSGEWFWALGDTAAEAIIGDWTGSGEDKTGFHSGNDWYLDVNGNRQWDAGDVYYVFSGVPAGEAVVGDWNGDGEDEIGIHSGERWYLDANGNGIWDTGDFSFTFGIAGDEPVVGDWDGNGTDDVGVHRGNGWYLDVDGSQSWSAGDRYCTFGIAGDEAVIGDWNDDGTEDIGVHRGNMWYLDADGNGAWSAPDVYFAFGARRDEPVVGDWDGDGIDQVGVHRGDTWYFDSNPDQQLNTADDESFTFAIPRAEPVAGDWNGDGVDDVGVHLGWWWHLDCNGDHCWDGPADLHFRFGILGDEAVVGDWNGDGIDEVGVHRGDMWYLDVDGSNSWNVPGDQYFVFGMPGDEPIVGDWNGDGKDEVGVHRGNMWYLDVDGNGQLSEPGDVSFAFGIDADEPIVGDWNGDGKDEVGVRRGDSWYLNAEVLSEVRDGTLFEHPLPVRENGTATMAVRLKAAPTDPLLVTVTAQDGADAAVGVPADPLTFDQFNWNLWQLVTLTGANDIDSRNGTATVTVSVDGSVPVSLTVCVTDDNRAILVSPGGEIIDDQARTVGFTTTSTEGAGWTVDGDSTIHDKASGSEATAAATWQFDNLSAGDYEVLVTWTTGADRATNAPFTVADGDPQSGTALGTIVINQQQLPVGPQFDLATGSSPGPDWHTFQSLGVYSITSGSLSVQLQNLADGTVVADAVRLMPITTDALQVSVPEADTGTFWIRLEMDPGTTLPVQTVMASGDSDLYLADGSQSTFTAGADGNWSHWRPVTLGALDDSDTTRGQREVLCYGLDWSAPPIVAVESENDRGLEILLEGVPVTDLHVPEGSSRTYSIRLTAKPDAGVKVMTALSGDNSLRFSDPDGLTFDSNNWNSSQFFTIIADADADSTNGRATLIATATLSLTAEPWAAVSTSVTEEDDDTAGVTVQPLGQPVTGEDGSQFELAVALNTQPMGPVKIVLLSTNANEGILSRNELLFGTSDWNQAQTVVVTGVDDYVADGSIAYQIGFTVTSVQSHDYHQLAVPPVAVTNTDNDTAGITLKYDSTLTTTELNGTAVFAVVLNSQPTGNVEIGVQSEDQTEGTVSPASLTFTPATWNMPQLVTVKGVDDGDSNDGDTPYQVNVSVIATDDPSYQSLSSAKAVLVNIDDDYDCELNSQPADFTAMGGYVYYTQSAPGVGRELWMTDGTRAGLVADINPGTGDSSPAELVALGGTLFFTAFDPLAGIELWKTDGTNTARVSDIHPGPGHSSPANLVEVNGLLYFTANDGTHGVELWQSDGSAENTRRVAAGSASVAYSSPSMLTDVDGQLYFVASDPFHGVELWYLDSEDTACVVDINPGPEDSSPANLTAYAGKVFFTADDGGNGTELWRSDGDPTGTKLVKDICPGLAGSSPAGLTVVSLASQGDLLYFTAFEPSTGFELWRTDGTLEGTVRLSNFAPAKGVGSDELAVLGNEVFFAAADGDNGKELWATDGTTLWPTGDTLGARLVTDLNPGTADSSPSSLTVVGTELYFAAYTPGSGVELWKTDGQQVGTQPIAEIAAGISGSYPHDLTVLGSSLVFVADDGLYGPRAWGSAGLQSNTAPIEHSPVIEPIGDQSIDEGTELALTVSGHDVDPPVALTYTLEPGSPAGTTIGFSTGEFRWTPTEAQGPGTYTLQVRVSDGELSSLKSFTVTVNEVNQAPVLNADAAPFLTKVGQLDQEPAGNTVAEIVANGSITDVDNAPVEAIAVIGVDNTNGNWQYNLGNGWTNFSARTGQNVDLTVTARLLGPSDQIRFVPNSSYNGTATFSFRAWDQTAGSAGAVANTSSSGGNTAFSSASDTAAIVVKAKPDLVGTRRNTTWYLDLDGDVSSFAFGIAGDRPVVGDWNGDGWDEAGVHRADKGMWFFDVDGNGCWNASGDTYFSFGAVGDVPLVGDWNGDGKDEVGVYRPSTGMWYLDGDGNRRWNASGDTYFSFGVVGDVPLVGDWNGDGRDEIGVHRPSSGYWYLDTDGNRRWNFPGDTYFNFGVPGGQPVVGDWNGDSVDDIGVYLGDTWYLDEDGDHRWNASSDRSFEFGSPGDAPVVGCWPHSGTPAQAGVSGQMGTTQGETAADDSTFQNDSGELAIPVSDKAQITLLGGFAAGDVDASASLDVTGNDTPHAGLVARYTDQDNQSMYLGALVNLNDQFFAEIWRNTAGTWTRLSSIQVESGCGTVRFNVVDATQELYFNGQLVASTSDHKIASPGAVGVLGPAADLEALAFRVLTTSAIDHVLAGL